MNKEKFAELLNGRQYREEITKEEENQAKEHGLIVCFGQSDDLLEFRGAIYDEIGAWDGTVAHLVIAKGGNISILPSERHNELMEIFNETGIEYSLPKVGISAVWSPKEPECSWLIKTEIPHVTFDILEDGELYCRGIVVSKEDIAKALITQCKPQYDKVPTNLTGYALERIMDQFAGHALQGMITKLPLYDNKGEYGTHVSDEELQTIKKGITGAAYEYASYMMLSRIEAMKWLYQTFK